MRPLAIWLSVTLLACATGIDAQPLAPGRNILVVRGQAQHIYFLPANSAIARGRAAVLFLPGDGGWRGFAIEIAQRMATWGYDVYGLDTKRYLEGFTGSQMLTAREAERDLLEVTARVQGATRRVMLVGWSEGGGLLVLTGATGRKAAITGVVAFGLTRRGVLGWRLRDDLTYLTGAEPKEPWFEVAPYLGRIAPLPFALIEASGDRSVPADDVQVLFSAAREPKRLVIVRAENHRFAGGRDEFFLALRESLAWIDRGGR